MEFFVRIHPNLNRNYINSSVWIFQAQSKSSWLGTHRAPRPLVSPSFTATSRAKSRLGGARNCTYPELGHLETFGFLWNMKLLLGHFSLDTDVSQQALVFSSFMGTVTRRKEIVQLSILNSNNTLTYFWVPASSGNSRLWQPSNFLLGKKKCRLLSVKKWLWTVLKPMSDKQILQKIMPLLIGCLKSKDWVRHMKQVSNAVASLGKCDLVS